MRMITKISYIACSIVLFSNVHCADTSSIIEECMESRYTDANVSLLKKGADNGESTCQHFYGEYLLHMEGKVEDAFDYLSRAAESGCSESLALIQSIIGENLPIEDSKNEFCSKWVEVFEQNIRTISGGQFVPVEDVCLYLLQKDIEQKDNEEFDVSSKTTPIKLQKELFYAQSCSLSLYSRPLFDESIDAWVHGPVVGSVYQDYKNFGKREIILPHHDMEKKLNLNNEIRQLLDAVFKVCRRYSAWGLRDATHTPQSSWDRVYNGGLGKNKPIPYFLMMHETSRPAIEIREEIKFEHKRKRDDSSY